MKDFADTLDHLLTFAVLGPWWYTLSRAVLLLFIVLTLWRGRRYPWLLVGLGIGAVIVGMRVLADMQLGGADRPYSVYALGTNLGSLLLYLAVNHLITLLARYRRADRERRVALAERDQARAWIHQYQNRLGEPQTLWPPDPITGGTP